MPDASKAGASSPFARRAAAPVSLSGGAYALTASDAGRTLLNTAATSQAVITPDANLPLDFEFYVYQFNASFGTQIQLPAGQSCRNASSSTSVGGTVTWAANAGNAQFRMRKITPTLWVNMLPGGLAPTLA